MYSLQGKVAIITGGGSGIGKAIATLFAKQGATVHIIDINSITGNEAAMDIKAMGCNAFSHSKDISHQETVVNLISSINKVDILVNSAGIAHIGNVENTSSSDVERLLSVNVKGVYNCIFATIPLMKKNGKGVILNMASTAASVGISDRFAYSMSKGAVLAMTLSVAKDYLKDNIRCNCISPARIHTPFVDGFIEKNYPNNKEEMFAKLSASQPIGRMGTPEEVAHLALYLCSDEAGFVTGSDYPIDGGFIRLNS
jgi:2-keto-3-deoxy-L-fuconate dehydrogenase